MKKQELIAVYERISNFAETVEIKSVIEKLKQLEEPETQVPQFVADYIEFKKTYDFHVYGAMRVIEDHYDKRVQEWFYEGNIETFVRAWLYGYTIEEEKKYRVSLKNGQPLVKAPLGGNFYFNQNITAGKCKATRKELEDAGFGWVFNCLGIEIEEVEE